MIKKNFDDPRWGYGQVNYFSPLPSPGVNVRIGRGGEGGEEKNENRLFFLEQWPRSVSGHEYRRLPPPFLLYPPVN